MGVKGLNPANLVMIPDTATYFGLMNLTQVETVEKFGDSATIKNGRIVALDGIEIVNREELTLATATGEIPYIKFFMPNLPLTNNIKLYAFLRQKSTLITQ